eukprot:UN21080
MYKLVLSWLTDMKNQDFISETFFRKSLIFFCISCMKSLRVSKRSAYIRDLQRTNSHG